MEKEVVLSVNGQESRIVFIDHEHGEMEVSKDMEYKEMVNQGMFQVENMIQTYCPHAMMVVMAVDDISSLELAEHLLLYLSHSDSIEEKAVILVANKADLVRNREIKTGAGKELAVKYNVKYIESSPGEYIIVQLGKLNKINILKLFVMVSSSYCSCD